MEAGQRKLVSKKSMERNERIRALVSDYANRDTFTYFKGIGHNFDF